VELLFFETPSRPYTEVAAELGLAVGSIGFTRQKCSNGCACNSTIWVLADARNSQEKVAG